MVKPYEIWIDGYTHMSGGIRALHVLRDELVARGLPAWMKYERHEQNVIGVYPEIVAGDPEGYSHIVRWLLNRADLPNDGLTFTWDEALGSYPLLRVDIVEPDLWAPYTGPRSGVGYWVGKGDLIPELVPRGAVKITRGNFTKRHELAEFVRSLDYLISFDPFTAVTLEATLTGTPVVIIAPGSPWEGHRTLRNGIAWGFDGLEEARATVGLVPGDYEQERVRFGQSIDRFVEHTQGVFW